MPKAWTVDFAAGAVIGPENTVVSFELLPNRSSFNLRINPQKGATLSTEVLQEIADEAAEAIKEALRDRALH